MIETDIFRDVTHPLFIYMQYGDGSSAQCYTHQYPNSCTFSTTIVVNWEPPEYANGELTSYEVCLSEEELEGEEDCNVLSLTIVPPDILTFEQSQLIQTTQLVVQVLRKTNVIVHEDMCIAEKVIIM